MTVVMLEFIPFPRIFTACTSNVRPSLIMADEQSNVEGLVLKDLKW